MKYGYVYQRNGAPLVSWKNGPPRQTRAADAVSLGGTIHPTVRRIARGRGWGGARRAVRQLARGMSGLGSLDGSTLEGNVLEIPLPRPGSPEPIGCYGGCGGRRDVVIDLTSPTFVIGAAVGYFLLTKLFKRSPTTP